MCLAPARLRVRRGVIVIEGAALPSHASGLNRSLRALVMVGGAVSLENPYFLILGSGSSGRRGDHFAALATECLTAAL